MFYKLGVYNILYLKWICFDIRIMQYKISTCETQTGNRRLLIFAG